MISTYMAYNNGYESDWNMPPSLSNNDDTQTMVFNLFLIFNLVMHVSIFIHLYFTHTFSQFIYACYVSIFIHFY
jgi:hypothetical protein